MMKADAIARLTEIIQGHCAHADNTAGSVSAEHIAKDIADKMPEVFAESESGNLSGTLARHIPTQFGICRERKCGALFNLCEMKDLMIDSKKEEERHATGKCPVCGGEAESLREHENNVAIRSFAMADQVANDQNTFSGSTERLVGKAFAMSMLRQHRTLQQAFGRGFLFPVIAEFAKACDNGFYDGRNEAFVKFCKRISVESEKTGLPLI